MSSMFFSAATELLKDIAFHEILEASSGELLTVQYERRLRIRRRRSSFFLFIPSLNDEDKKENEGSLFKLTIHLVTNIYSFHYHYQLICSLTLWAQKYHRSNYQPPTTRRCVQVCRARFPNLRLELRWHNRL